MEQNPKNNAVTVTILGSGTCVPSLARSACSVLIQVDDRNLVFDLGPGTMRRLLEAGVDIFDVSHVFFSHFHPDHTGELVPFLFSNKYPDILRRNKMLTVCGGIGFTRLYNQLKSVYNQWIDVNGQLNIIEFDNSGKNEHIFDGFIITTTPVEHSPESIAFKVTAPDGTTVVYSGDTDYSENLIELAQNADLFICECAFPDQMKVEGHSTPSYAGKMASLANVKKLVLTHFYPECGLTEITNQCHKTYAGPLVLARDLLTIEVD